MKRKIDYSTKTDLQLVELAKLEDNDARNVLVLRHTSLIRYIIHKYNVRNKEDREDLFQDCCLAFCKAIDKFKDGYNSKITSYAAWWIHAHIKLEINKRKHAALYLDLDDVSEHREACNIPSCNTDSIDFINVLSDEERKLADSLFNNKEKLTDVANNTQQTTGQVFSKKEKLLKKLRKIIRNDRNYTERTSAFK